MLNNNSSIKYEINGKTKNNKVIHMEYSVSLDSDHDAIAYAKSLGIVYAKILKDGELVYVI